MEPPEVDLQKKPRRRQAPRWVWQAKAGPAFWTITGTISIVVNIILVVALILMGRQIFDLKQVVSQQLVGGLYTNFVKMDRAHIQTTIKIDTTIPVQFDLPVKTNSIVTLIEATFIKGASVSLSTGGLSIVAAPTDITLPAGTKLPIALNISVPVNTTIPVVLSVPMDIPLNQTVLHAPFNGLQNVLQPYRSLLNGLPNSWSETFCAKDAQGHCHLP